MAFPKFSLLAIVALVVLGSASADLKTGFYRNICPKAVYIVHEEMIRVLSVAPSLAGPLLRMHFHDCFVNGCDGSILLNPRNSSEPVEKVAPPNLSLRGYSVIDGIKTKLEKVCPGTVSCADIVALVAREAVQLRGGPFYEVPTGRRDGSQSTVIDALQNLPPPTLNITLLTAFFARKNLSKKDLVVLSGGHTLGTSHCSSFTNRLYNFNGKGDSDKTLDEFYVSKLKSKCKPNDQTTLVEMDPGSFRTFDLGYFKIVSKRRGLFQSDAALLDDPVTKAYVKGHTDGSSATNEFFKDFAESMVKMGNIEVLTGTSGEIRKKCGFRN